MIENKQDYYSAISATFGTDEETTKIIFDIVVDKDIKQKDIRDTAIVLKFDQYRKEMYNSTITDIYYELMADFNCSYKLVQQAVLSRRKGKIKA